MSSGMWLGFSLCCHFVSVLLDAQVCLADGSPASDKQSVRHRVKCFHVVANKATSVCFSFKHQGLCFEEDQLLQERRTEPGAEAVLPRHALAALRQKYKASE